MIRRLAVPAAAVAVLLGIAGCGSTEQASPSDRPTVVASTNVWASVVRAVAGDTVDVKTIIDSPSADPHSYESSPSDAADVARADLVVYNGGGYDAFMDQFRAQSGDKPAIEAFTLLPAQPAGGSAEPRNEHVWYDLSVVRQVGQQVADELSRLHPAGAKQYAANAQRFSADIGALAGKEKAIAAAHGGDQVAMTEPVAYYLVEAGKLRDVTPPQFSEAVEEESDPPAGAVAATTDLITQHKAKVLIFNTQTETPVIDQIRTAAQEAGVPVVSMTETLPPGVDYQDWMSGQIDSLSAALQASTRQQR